MTPHLRLIRGGGYWPVIQSQSKDQTSVETLKVSYKFAKWFVHEEEDFQITRGSGY